jgi:hypothetical protein
MKDAIEAVVIAQTVPPKTTSFSVRGAGFGGRVPLPAGWRYLAKARLQPTVEIGDEIMKSNRTSGLGIPQRSKVMNYFC